MHEASAAGEARMQAAAANADHLAAQLQVRE